MKIFEFIRIAPVENRQTRLFNLVQRFLLKPFRHDTDDTYIYYCTFIWSAALCVVLSMIAIAICVSFGSSQPRYFYIIGSITTVKLALFVVPVLLCICLMSTVVPYALSLMRTLRVSERIDLLHWNPGALRQFGGDRLKTARAYEVLSYGIIFAMLTGFAIPQLILSYNFWSFLDDSIVFLASFCAIYSLFYPGFAFVFVFSRSVAKQLRQSILADTHAL